MTRYRSKCKRKCEYSNQRSYRDNYRSFNVNNRFCDNRGAFNNNFGSVNEFGQDDPFGQGSSPCLNSCGRMKLACYNRYGPITGFFYCNPLFKLCEVGCARSNTGPIS